MSEARREGVGKAAHSSCGSGLWDTGTLRLWRGKRREVGKGRGKRRENQRKEVGFALARL